jgi:predicted RNase H-like nuclease
MTVAGAGVDGCRSGWVVATRAGVHVTRSLAMISRADFDVIAVDMPIGLPDDWSRRADRAARAFISPRGSCVFPTPPRPLIDYDDYAQANHTSKSLFGRGLTKQTFNLFPQIRDVDAVVDVARQDGMVEAHPECCFRALVGRVLVSKHCADGLAARRRAVEAVFGPVVTRLPGAGVDDVLDAYALLWTAERHGRGEAMVFGGDEIDRRGLVMRIVA